MALHQVILNYENFLEQPLQLKANDLVLYRGDKRKPEELKLQGGFAPRTAMSTPMDAWYLIEHCSQSLGYVVSTSTNPTIADGFKGNGYVYEIQGDNFQIVDPGIWLVLEHWMDQLTRLREQLNDTENRNRLHTILGELNAAIKYNAAQQEILVPGTIPYTSIRGYIDESGTKQLMP